MRDLGGLEDELEVEIELGAGVEPDQMGEKEGRGPLSLRCSGTVGHERAELLERFGMFGIRISIAVLAAGVTDAEGLADELLERSGLVALRDVIDQQFAQRSDMLKAHTALVSLRTFVQAFPIVATPYIIADIEPLLADSHAFEELRLLSQLHSRPTTLNEDEIASLRRIIGGSGTNAVSRLGLTPEFVTTIDSQF